MDRSIVFESRNVGAFRGTLADAVHLMSEQHWNRAMDETLRWLMRDLT